MPHRLLLALVTACLITLFWQLELFLPVKLLVVYVHELGHGFAALLSGAQLQEINIQLNEWGETLVKNLSSPAGFILTVSAGYLGSMLLGALLLNRALAGSFERLTTGILALLLFYSGFLFTQIGQTSFMISIFWSLALAIIALSSRILSRYTLLSLGVFFIWYCFYDLFDFTDQIQETDIGILANWLQDQYGWFRLSWNYNQLTTALALLFALTISILALLGIYPAIGQIQNTLQTNQSDQFLQDGSPCPDSEKNGLPEQQLSDPTEFQHHASQEAMIESESEIVQV